MHPRQKIANPMKTRAFFILTIRAQKNAPSKTTTSAIAIPHKNKQVQFRNNPMNAMQIILYLLTLLSYNPHKTFSPQLEQKLP
jgi:hypothetical protein